MNKIKNKILNTFFITLAGISSCGATFEDDPYRTTRYITGKMSPIDVGDDNEVSFVLTNLAKSVLCKTYIFARLGNNPYQQIKMFAYKTYNTNVTRTFKFKVDKSYFSPNESTWIRIKLTQQKDNSVVYLDREFELLTKDRNKDGSVITIQPDMMEGITFIGKPNYTVLNSKLESGYSLESDIFRFRNFGEEYVDKYFYRIDLTFPYIFYRNNFYSSSEISLSYDDAYYEIYDPEGIFEELSSVIKDGYRKIPIKTYLEKSGSGINIRFETVDDFYVNEETLEMSSTYQKGYKRTRYLYFPKSAYDIKKDYEFRLVLTNLTENSYNILYTFYYSPTYALIGSCKNSKYCISASLNLEE